MNLSNDIYLRSAFKELDAFAIPGIGTFKKVYHAAEESRDDQSIYPPRIEIEFSREVSPALLLNQYLTQNIYLKPAEAEKILEEIRHSIQHALEETGVFDLPGIGKLKKSPDGALRFFPTQGNENFFSQEFFGLQPVSYEGQEEEEGAAASQTHTMPPKHPPYPPTPKKRSSIWGWRSAMLVSIVVLVGLFAWLNGEVRVNYKRASIVKGVKGPEEMVAENQIPSEAPAQVGERALPDSLSAEDSQPGVPTPSGEASQPLVTRSETPTPSDPAPTSSQVARSAEQEPANPVPQTSPAPPPPRTQVSRGIDNETPEEVPGNSTIIFYHIIAGSFDDQAKATQMVADLTEKGYDAVILFPSSRNTPKYRVSVFRSPDRTKVDTYRNRLIRQGWEENATWIYKEPK